MIEVVKKEVLKLLDVGVIYPIFDSKWVSPVQVVPKKRGVWVIKNGKDELVATRIMTGWRMCVDYRMLNKSIRKYHFPLSFIDHIIKRLEKHSHFCYLDGFSRFFQILFIEVTKRKWTSLVLIGRLHISKCFLDYPMHLLTSSAVWCRYFILSRGYYRCLHGWIFCIWD